MAQLNAWLINNPQAITWPERREDITPDFARKVMAVCNKAALVDIVNVSVNAAPPRSPVDNAEMRAS